MENIRNFTIIAHVDHGKSTLADRLLEVTGTVEKRKMKAQVLDSMELERERGITIKMQPVRMLYREKYILNLIDTPGHIDFSYEVSRALRAVEGSILLIDATQGVQAQTITTLEMAKNLNLTIIPVVSKIDSPLARTLEVKKEIALLLKCDENDVLGVSGKTGEGVENLLEEIVKKIPSPQARRSPDELPGENQRQNPLRSLIFDFQYSTHRGVEVYVRIMSGTVKKGDELLFKVSGKKFTALEVGIFTPEEKAKDSLSAGEIGYIVTGIKEPGVASVGDTVATLQDTLPPIKGYLNPQPVVWSSVYPESQDDFELLKQSLAKLKLSDSSLSFEEESSGILGRGYRCGFLGMLHLEIITERLKREFNLSIIISSPTIQYQVLLKGGKTEEIYTPSAFPEDYKIEKVFEPWAAIKLITPSRFLGPLMTIIFEHEGVVGASENFGEDRVSVSVEMPLRELMRNFFDKVKSQTSGFASLSYHLLNLREAEVVKLEILVAGDPIPAFTKIVSKKNIQFEGEASVEKLYRILPRQMFVIKIQAQAMGRIISSRTLSAFKKDVTQHMYGGDITRKMKLREKQKKGKLKMKSLGTVNIPQDVFLKMVKSE
ncbi:MAG: translation elongation factor 4 [Patescibacteria group bacterium]